MLFVLLTVLVTASCLALAAAQLWRVSTATSAHIAELARSLRRVPREQRFIELAARVRAGSWEQRLAIDLMEHGRPHEGYREGGSAVALETLIAVVVNNALSDLAHTLALGSGWPKASARVCALAGVLAAITTMGPGDGPPQHRGYSALPLAVLAIGLLGALASAWIGQAARSVERQKREGADALVEALVGAAPAMSQPGPSRRGRVRSSGTFRSGRGT